LQTGQYGGGIWMSSCNSSTYGFRTNSIGMGRGSALLLERFVAIGFTKLTFTKLTFTILRMADILVLVDIFLFYCYPLSILYELE
jgi:hypothetical protein